MTPEQIEARFQRIEELLIATAESQRLTSESQQRTIKELLAATAEFQRTTSESQTRTEATQIVMLVVLKQQPTLQTRLDRT